MHKLGTYLINLLISNNIQLLHNQIKHDVALQIFDIILYMISFFEYFHVVIYTIKLTYAALFYILLYCYAFLPRK